MNDATTQKNTARSLAALGAALFLAGLVTGGLSGSMMNPRMGLSSHLEGVMNGTLLIALGAVWGHVRLSAGEEAWAFRLLAFGSVTNWLATLLAAGWGAGMGMMPIAAQGHHAMMWQEQTVTTLLLALSVAMLGGMALVLKGLLAKGD